MKWIACTTFFVASLCNCFMQGISQNNQAANRKNSQPQIFAETVICTGEYETHPAFTPSGDTLYFLKCLPDANFCTIVVSYQKNGTWSPPEVVSFSGQYNDVDPFVTKNGNTIYFVSNRPIHPGDPVKEDWDIWKVERGASDWGQPIHLEGPVNDPTASEYFPTMSDNGNLYFGSSKTGGKGKADIYMAVPENQGFSQPRNLGDSINTPGNEYEPFIAPDESYLIFMATGAGGITDADFYISFNRNGKWTKGRKLPEPVNSAATEWGGKVTRDGNYFFFGSSRNKIYNVLPGREDMDRFRKRLTVAGNGLGDIYKIEFPGSFFK